MEWEQHTYVYWIKGSIKILQSLPYAIPDITLHSDITTSMNIIVQNAKAYNNNNNNNIYDNNNFHSWNENLKKVTHEGINNSSCGRGPGLIRKGFDELIEGVPRNPYMKEIQKTVRANTADTLRRALSM